ncbi:MAG: hypothetical protein N4A53_05905 [Pelagimonas sp.]|jgi:hypothetical protein|nr:hypothetical protein [Pelagimonas sp.]
MLKTKSFGKISLEEGRAILRDSADREITLDLIEIAHDADKLAATSAFLDGLRTHMDTIHNGFMAHYARIASFVPEWLFDEAPELWKQMFPNRPEPGTVKPDQIWQALELAEIWVDQSGQLTLGFPFRDQNLDFRLTAQMSLTGQLGDLRFAS